MATKKIKNKKPKGDLGYKRVNKYAKKQAPAGLVGKKQKINRPAQDVSPMNLLPQAGKAGRQNPSIYNI